ncbi:hypothetical protein CEUSTIGMA_g9846.t1 [Chlamydomonas eustigma]|uniref:CTLH domain-containing protein n=1 Tax=Chlamydomonas eustigma TaxID=1157962 RepID=A0A250XH70_9CHLO|nr:hypothetical protein CEUSTIGMA_g9846.t1 [Chlamydomonas eustigma]|eukprot:GAX82418.1 hypothetical protein CEUSTIGMA_g9846.t1 [Chlamydomonas eustigma]
MSSKINMEQWEAKLSAVNIPKEEMNKLIMNFLITEGYVEAAKMFEKESGTAASMDLSTIQERMEIRRAVQSGQMDVAIDKVNDMNPEILETQEELFFHMQQQRLIELIRKGKTEEALQFAEEYLAPQGEEHPRFLEELERTVTLLAFHDAKSSPLGDLMDIAQRQKTASELNAAILHSQCLDKESRLPTLLKILFWSQAQLDDKCAYPHITDLVTGQLGLPSDPKSA